MAITVVTDTTMHPLPFDLLHMTKAPSNLSHVSMTFTNHAPITDFGES